MLLLYLKPSLHCAAETVCMYTNLASPIQYKQYKISVYSNPLDSHYLIKWYQLCCSKRSRYIFK